MVKAAAPSLRVVLVRPRNPLNIGAAARAMANFGYSDLAVVNPYKPVWRETVSAVGAEKLVLAAKAHKTLDEALKDCQLILGTTALRERNIHRPMLRLKEILPYLKKNKIAARRTAILFGSEKTGLSNEHLARCHALVTIPTHPQTPSMNLGQAVAVCCYEISRENKNLGPALPADVFQPVSDNNRAQLIRQALEVFEALDYLKYIEPAKREEKIRRTFLRWRIQDSDLPVLFGFFRYINKLKVRSHDQ